ncbi:MAG: hypothetical protein LBC76_07985 [Treponema sp.]|jgi:hypothetical protein|nr:hypothetical protein [Treponema sp.]
MYVKSFRSIPTSQDRAIKASQKKAAASQRGFYVDGVFIAVEKRKPSKLQKLESDLKRLQDNYDTCIRNGMAEQAAQFKAAIEKTVKQIAKEKAA